jgi:DNA-binding response OmpR family regulator
MINASERVEPVRGIKPLNAALVVEDDSLLAETIADGLEELGCSPVLRVTSITSALKVIENDDIRLAVVDTEVRGLSTEPVLERLDASDVAHVVASYDNCKSLPGHAPYLQKPFGFFQLKVAVMHAREMASVRAWSRKL